MELVRNKTELPTKFDLRVSAKLDEHSFKYASVPGDKSISQRAIMMNAIAEGKGVIHNVLRSRDIESCIAILRQLGVTFAWNGNALTVYGLGLQSLRIPDARLEIGNTATSARLIMSVLAGHPFAVELAGNRLLTTRPMDWVAQPLIEMGASITYLESEGYLPLVINGRFPLSPINIEATVASAQEKSAFLFAGLYADGTSSYRQMCQSRDHTERLMKYFGIDIEIQNNVTSIRGGYNFAAKDVIVPGDLSSAAFLLAAFTIRSMDRKKELWIRDVGVNPTRFGFVSVLREMGLDLKLHRERQLISGEPIADLYCTTGKTLTSVHVEGNEKVQSLIDEVPLLAVVSAFAEGTTVIRNCRELKDKDTNRLETTAKLLAAFGLETSYDEDELIIFGGRSPSPAVVDSYGDHRIAMTAAVLASSMEKPSIIRNCGCIAVSYPEFLNDLSQFAEIEILQ
ncbi:3-phosphoshikimate 1-carboxyvinyltransferase [Paenibacillus odorifer]|uniref:3-phosphoshikimate 1-carboxyvinyltransferase n=1 Tax=Paenibacillus odorifer TaxID=189426 RepID=UPI0009D6EA70|nr:3-phosphoshikimate 1-carboxyvinyltransferase [Paenibacillus odorifer]